jgi:phosphomannomutase
VVRRALQQAGFKDLHSVPEQSEPDMDFPTVAFPNPEEKGAMDRVVRLAAEIGADLAMANDPDADRLALAAPDRSGQFRVLTGNQTGLLFAHYLLDQDIAGGKRLVISSIVSSPLIEDIARYHGARWEPTLTGFKWICNRAIELEQQLGARFVFGFEEALGYVAGTLVRDKDGISSAVLAADMAAWCKVRGRTLHDELEAIAERHGTVISRSLSLMLHGPDGAEKIERMMQRTRSSPPSAIGKHPVSALTDLQEGIRKSRDGSRSPVALPPADAIVLELEGGHRIVMRPSGTEPKIKFYLDVRPPREASDSPAAAREKAERILDELVPAFLNHIGGSEDSTSAIP